MPLPLLQIIVARYTSNAPVEPQFALMRLPNAHHTEETGCQKHQETGVPPRAMHE
jgi:hypothetical protein